MSLINGIPANVKTVNGSTENGLFWVCPCGSNNSFLCACRACGKYRTEDVDLIRRAELGRERPTITEGWLKSIGFKWHQFDLQPDKHWLLWIGSAFMERQMFSGFEDLGLELAPANDGEWHCWFRSDTAGRYHRFIHIRHLKTEDELIALLSALIGYPFDAQNALYGILRRPEDARRLKAEDERLDLRLRRECPKWSNVEKDDTRGRPLPEHMEELDKANLREIAREFK